MRTSNLFLSASLAMWLTLGAAAQNPLARGQQVIDQDPVTGVRTVFTGVQDGCGIVVAQCARESTSFAYDLNSGLLRSSTMRQFGGVGTIQVDLRLARR